MKFEQLCQSINVFFMQNPVIRVLIPISTPIMAVCVAFHILGYFIALGGAVQALSFLGFFFMLLLILSECRFKMAAMGLGVYSLMYAYSIFRSLWKYHTMNWGSIIYLVVFGYLAYQCYRKSLQINK